MVTETTALGAAYAAGYWKGEQDIIDNWADDKRWEPPADEDERARLYRNGRRLPQRPSTGSTTTIWTPASPDRRTPHSPPRTGAPPGAPWLE